MDDTTAEVEQISGNNDNKSVDDVQMKQSNATVDVETNESEKYDISPENFEKSCYDITPNDELSTSVSGLTTTTTPTTATNTNNDTVSSHSMVDDKTKQTDDTVEVRNKSTGFAFTIDFNEGKTVDNRKFKEMAERFQNRQLHQQEQRRHRRGVSLSKLDDDSRKSTTSLNNMDNGPVTVDDTNVPSSVATKPPVSLKYRSSKVMDTKVDEPTKCDTKVALRKSRPATQTTVNLKDSSKRHSWSPRSSLNYDKIPQMPQHQLPKNEPAKCTDSAGGSFQPKSSILQRAMENNSSRPSSKTSAKVKPTTMNLAKKAVSDHVVTAPLEYVRDSDDDGGSIGDASQATYTLDGDNYTEEEKERMSIDKLGKRNFDLSIDSRSRLEIGKNYAASIRNSLPMNFSRDIKMDSRPSSQRNSVERDQLNAIAKASPKSAKSYLDKFKTRVKTIGDRTFHKNNNVTKATTNEKLMNLQVVRADDSSPTDADHGTFTSITACGVLNKQQKSEIPTTNHTTNGNRKQSLTKFQIDSSEYVQPKVDESLMNSYTDYEKAKHNEYKLNIFSTISSYTSSGTSPVHTDDDNLSVECSEDKSISIKTAPTKNDWIQEWAKNARRRNNMLSASSATASPKLQHYSKINGSGERSKQAHLTGKDDDRMSQSCDTYFNHSEQFGDDVIEDSSDECIGHASRQTGRTKAITKTETVPQNSGLRPPISPTKIPSPMHTQLRARSTSANRSFRHSNAVSSNLINQN